MTVFKLKSKNWIADKTYISSFSKQKQKSMFRCHLVYPSYILILIYLLADEIISTCIFYRSELTKSAQKSSIDVFSSNLRNLLLSAPVKGHSILGIDPGFRNGCKCAVISQTGIQVMVYL